MFYAEIIKQAETAYVCVPARAGFVGINKRQSHTYCSNNRYGFAFLPTDVGVNCLLPKWRDLTSVMGLEQSYGS